MNATPEETNIEIENDSLAYLIWLMILGGIQLIAGIVFIDLFNFTALRQITRIRIRFFQSIICQDMAWYDKTTDYNFASRLTELVPSMNIKKLTRSHLFKKWFQ